ncbi:MAG: sigma-70 family RNA polymerase sigma factor [Actinomycetota bacterium]
MTPRSLDPALPEGVDEAEYVRIRGLMRHSVLLVWRSDHVIAGVGPWAVVDEAWSSMAHNGFRCEGPFLPFALRVARNKAIDALNRAEARRRDRSLSDPISTRVDDAEPLVLADVAARSAGADEEYFAKLEHLRTVQQVELAEEAIYRVLSDREREVFMAVRVNGKSRAAVGRELDPPISGQRVGQLVASAWVKVRSYLEEHKDRVGV